MGNRSVWLSVLALVVAGGAGSEPQVPTLRPNAQAYPRVNRAAGYELDAGWALKIKDRKFAAVSGLALDRQGRLWVYHRGASPLQIFRPDGTFESAWVNVTFKEPHQIRFDARGDVWLVDSGLHVVQHYKPNGTLVQTLGEPGTPGADKTHFNRPTDVAFGTRGDLYITDGYGNNRIVHCDGQGRYVGEWGGIGSKRGRVSLPHAIAADSRGRLYVADRNNARVQVFDEQGRVLDEWVNLIIPWHIVVGPNDRIYVCGSTPARWNKLGILRLPLGVPPKDQVVMVFTPEGRVERIWAFPLGQGNGQLEWVHGMAVASDGSLFLGDIQGKHVMHFRDLPPDPDALDAKGSSAARP